MESESSSLSKIKVFFRFEVFQILIVCLYNIDDIVLLSRCELIENPVKMMGYILWCMGTLATVKECPDPFFGIVQFKSQ